MDKMREEFEARFPVPNGVKWAFSAYMPDGLSEENCGNANEWQAKFEGWQAARQPQERGEAVAYLHFLHTFDGPPLEELSFNSDVNACFEADEDRPERVTIEPLYRHPTPDAGRVAEPDRLVHRYNRELVSRLQSFLDRLANDDYAGTKFEADGDALRDAMTFVRDAERALLNWQYEYEELEKGHRHYKSKADGLESQLAESREREGRMRKLLKEAAPRLHYVAIKTLQQENRDLSARVHAALAADKEVGE